jgi:hypothetical protein
LRNSLKEPRVTLPSYDCYSVTPPPPNNSLLQSDKVLNLIPNCSRHPTARRHPNFVFTIYPWTLRRIYQKYSPIFKMFIS